MKRKKKTLISIVGPTGIGKTKLAIAIAAYFKTEIISADSRQFYKEMYIGTAVPSHQELKAVTHHFVQHKSIFDSYSVGDFEREAMSKLITLFKEYDIVVLVGGSGLYIDALLKGLDRFPKIDPKIRRDLNEMLRTKGIEALQEQLKVLDNDYYAKVDIQNPHRLIRALEICMGTGKPYSSFLNKAQVKRPFQMITLGITAHRKIIYDRIEQRVDAMMQQGLLEEAKALFSYSALNALQTVGYKELFRHLNGEWDLEIAVSEIKKNTRRFAKRQLTWFKRDPSIIWIDIETNMKEIVTQISKWLDNPKDS
ncbi:MAG: tRNA (adenosine(37)-N6)-dimethylallyltransferase MiaA [Maribacter sp.]|nr:tRNA (adenosine(37)-N6)-dimethylallyltransferase MiaA [Maribacter sp.]